MCLEMQDLLGATRLLIIATEMWDFVRASKLNWQMLADWPTKIKITNFYTCFLALESVIPTPSPNSLVPL